MLCQGECDEHMYNSICTHVMYIYIYIYMVPPPNGPWFGAFDQYFARLFCLFVLFGCCVNIRGCHMYMICMHACMHAYTKAMTSASAI